MAVRFKQFLFPHGDTKIIEIDRPQHIERKAKALLSIGYRFEIELLPTGEVHMDCSFPGSDEPLGMKLVGENGPAVARAVDELIEECYAQAFVH